MSIWLPISACAARSLISAGRYRLSEIFHRMHTLFIRSSAAGFEEKAVRNLYVRVRIVVRRMTDAVWHVPLRRLGKAYLLTRVINEHI